jgi:hypothetical protein
VSGAMPSFAMRSQFPFPLTKYDQGKRVDSSVVNT